MQETIKLTDEDGTEIASAEVSKNKKGFGSYLRDVFVPEKFRGNGYGSELLDEVIETVDSPIYLEVEENNTVAVNLYRKKGFTIEERVVAQNGTVYLRMKKA